MRADHADGNIRTCGSVPCSVNYWLVEEGALRVCDSSNIVTCARLDSSIAIWNTGIGARILVNDLMNGGVNIIEVAEGTCPPPALACAQVPNSESTLQLEVRMEPDSQGSDDRVVSILASELGHNLGFDHSPCPSIMMPALCPTLSLALTTGDKDNYHNAYHADAVASFRGNLAGLHIIRFAWDGRDYHN